MIRARCPRSRTASERRRPTGRVPGLLLLIPIVLILGSPPVIAADTAPGFAEAREAVVDLTGRPFRDTVPLKPQSREDFREYVEKSLRQTYGPDGLSHLNDLYYLLGLFPREYPLRERLVTLYEQQAGAYYDPRAGSIRTLMEDLPPASHYFIYLHELVHAQQDQYFDLASHMRQIRRSRSLDRRLAFQFVIEGHANLVATASQTGASSLSESFFRSEAFGRMITVLARLTDLDPSRFNLLARSLMPQGSGAMTRSLQQLNAVPWILVQQLMDPYFLGQKRWFERGGRIGWKEAETWLKRPPSRTREVLYDNPDTGPTPPSLEELPGKSRYRDHPGLYLLLRWMGRLGSRPGWGRRVSTGPARIVATSEDRLMAWSIGAEGSTRRELLRTLAGALVPGDTRTRKPGQYLGREGPRYLRVQPRESGIILWFDDDTDIPRGRPWETFANDTAPGSPTEPDPEEPRS